MNVLGCIAALLAMALAYLSSSHQRLLAKPLGRAGRAAAWLLAGAALVTWVIGETSLPGVFGALTAIMLGAVIWPYVAWLLRPAADRTTR